MHEIIGFFNLVLSCGLLCGLEFMKNRDSATDQKKEIKLETSFQRFAIFPRLG